MKIKSLIFIFAVLCMSALLLGSCSRGTTGTREQPIQVMSVTVPLLPVNPGGPNIEVTLKNVSSESVVLLTASLGLSLAGQSNTPFVFNFDVSSSNPLLPANSISSKLALIGGSIADNTSYPLNIEGKLESGGTFKYTEQVQIESPTLQNAAPWPGVPVFSDSTSPIVTRINENFSIVLPSAPLFGWGWQNKDLSAFALVETKTIPESGNVTDPYGPNAFLFKALETGDFQVTLYVPSKPPQQVESFKILVNP